MFYDSATEPQTNMILVKVSPQNNYLLCIHVNVKWFKWKFCKKNCSILTLRPVEPHPNTTLAHKRHIYLEVSLVSLSIHSNWSVQIVKEQRFLKN